MAQWFLELKIEVKPKKKLKALTAGDITTLKESILERYPLILSAQGGGAAAAASGWGREPGRVGCRSGDDSCNDGGAEANDRRLG